MITASILYDYIQCPHKVWRDKHGPQEEKIIETNPFVQLLWERGIQHEQEIIANLGKYVDVSNGSLAERETKTKDEFKKGTELIYQGVIKHEDLLGIPDLLKKVDNNYIPIDIKSGKGFEDSDYDEVGKPKKHYAVQLCLYSEILVKLGLKTNPNANIIDISGNEVHYILDQPSGKRSTQTWIDIYKEMVNEVELLLSNKKSNKPALSGSCKLCPWYTSCKKWVLEQEDLTQIFYVGRGVRDTINTDLGITQVKQLPSLDLKDVLERKKKDKSFLKGIGESTISKAKQRATILLEGKPCVYSKLEFPETSYELYFDIEDDPTQDFVYLHGIYQNHKGEEKYIYFLADSDNEKEAWKLFWDYIKSLPQEDFSVYYYSHHEKSTYKAMQLKYPDVITAEEVEEFFNAQHVIDLYQLILNNTDWPLSSYSLKDIATYTGFKWRDETPSGALSIQWFNEYRNNGDQNILQRILDYNEDDCKALFELKKYLIGLVY